MPLVVIQVFTLARDYADLSNRTSPNAQDLLLACQDRGLDLDELKRLGTTRGKKRRLGGMSVRITLLTKANHFSVQRDPNYSA